MTGRVGKRPTQIGVGHRRQQMHPSLRRVDHIQQPRSPCSKPGKPFARERIGHAIADQNHRRLDRQDLLPELLETGFGRVEARPGDPADRVAAPAQVAEDQVLVGIADRQQRLQVAIPLVTLDQGVADQNDAIAVLSSNRGGWSLRRLSARTNTTARQQEKTLSPGGLPIIGRRESDQAWSNRRADGAGSHDDLIVRQ